MRIARERERESLNCEYRMIQPKHEYKIKKKVVAYKQLD